MNFYKDMPLVDFLDEVNDALKTLLQGFDRVRAEEIGLDERSSYGPLWINEDYIIATEASARQLNYYGGFEYVEKDCVQRVGDYVLYSREDSRVNDHIRRWELRNLTPEKREAILEKEEEDCFNDGDRQNDHDLYQKGWR